MAEQLGVDRAHAHATVGDPVADRGDERARIGPGLGQRGAAVVRAAVDPPGAVAMGGVAVVVAVGGARRVAAPIPDPRDRQPVDRPQHRSLLGRHRRQVRGAAEPEARGQLDAGGADAGRLERAVQPLGVRAFGQPQAALPRAEAGPVRGDPGLQLQRQTGVGGDQRQHRMRRRGGPARVGAQRAEQARPVGRLERGEPLGGGRVLSRGPVELIGEPRLTVGAQLDRVTPV